MWGDSISFFFLFSPSLSFFLSLTHACVLIVFRFSLSLSVLCVWVVLCPGSCALVLIMCRSSFLVCRSSCVVGSSRLMSSAGGDGRHGITRSVARRAGIRPSRLSGSPFGFLVLDLYIEHIVRTEAVCTPPGLVPRSTQPICVEGILASDGRGSCGGIRLFG